jgi:hypothetical protein
MKWWVVVASLVSSTPVMADPQVAAHATREAPTSEHLVYVEVLGKAGLYGIGYERTLTSRLSLGIAASYAVTRDQQVATASPYVHGTLVRGSRHALFTELGASFVHSRIPSPVDDWDGMTDSGGGGFVSLGWERATRHLVMRTSASVIAGEGGIAPWLGFAIGVRP